MPRKKQKIRESPCRAYVFQVSNWHSGLGRIRVPKCVVDNIRRKFPGDGKYVGHKDVPISGSG